MENASGEWMDLIKDLTKKKRGWMHLEKILRTDYVSSISRMNKPLNGTMNGLEGGLNKNHLKIQTKFFKKYTNINNMFFTK